jgi:hypothetical protein
MSLLTGLVVLGLIIALVYIYISNKKHNEEVEALKAAQAEAWKTDYHNPSSPTYDPVRVEAEDAEAQSNPRPSDYAGDR